MVLNTGPVEWKFNDGINRLSRDIIRFTYGYADCSQNLIKYL